MVRGREGGEKREGKWGEVVGRSNRVICHSKAVLPSQGLIWVPSNSQ